MSDTASNVSHWETVASGLKGLVADYHDGSLFIDGSGFDRTDWFGLAAVTSDIGDDEKFFGTRSLNIIIVADGYNPPDDSNFLTQKHRIIAHFLEFADYRTLVYVDVGTLAAAQATDFDIPGYVDKIKVVCDALGEHGFVFGGTVDYTTASAADFRAAIVDFFKL